MATVLNKRINIEQRASGEDSIGQPTGAWTLVAAVWADVRNLSGIESVKSGADTSIVKASIRIRFCAGIDAGMRVTSGADVYDIKAVLKSANRQYLDLVCEAVA